MYEAHFGLKTRPFGSKAEGAGVFVGPQQAKIMNSLQKGLGAQDAVVTVTGPVGVGKTTIVSRALESISPGRMVAWVGRMQLAPDEVLELLLTGFGIRRQATGTIQKFAAFRRLLAERAAVGAQVAIVVEDAHRIGVNALMELEALTAADTGDSTSANIILMGQPGLHKLLATEDLARMKQRNRLRQNIDAFSLAEVTGYLKHSIRQAGGDYDTIFDTGVADIVFGCSEGIPRVINTLCETAMSTAAEENSVRVTAALMHQVAVDAFGYDGPIPEIEVAPVRTQTEVEPAPIEKVVEAEPKPAVQAEPAARASVNAEETNEPEIDWEPPPVVETEVSVVAEAPEPIEHQSRPPADATAEELAEDDLPPTARNLVVESGRYPTIAAPEFENGEPAGPVVESTADVEPDLEIPELINDTQPELNKLELPDEPGEPQPIVAAPQVEQTGSTVVLETLPESAIARPAEPVPAAATPKTDFDDDDDGEDFDLDAALSIDAGETNVMRGITPNMDTLARNAREEEEEEAPAPKAAPKPEPRAAEPRKKDNTKDDENDLPSLDDLPTLSNSMRVDVDKEVKKAKKAEAQKAPQPVPPARVPPLAKPEPAPMAQVSAMTARIAATDPSKRDSNVDSLEAALEAAKKGDFASIKPAEPFTAPNGAATTDASTRIPEITLDNALPDQPENDEAMQKLAADIGSAKSLEDMSDMMAETLFGSQAFDKIAAEVVANPPENHELANAPPAGPSPVKLELEESLHSAAANDAVDAAPALNLDAGAKVESIATADPGEVALKESVAMRIDMLKAMQSKVADTPPENVELGSDRPEDPAPKAKGPQPEPIENQISTSMTQTLEALNLSKVADKAAAEDDDDKDKKSGGLFSRFRKSS